MFKGMERLMKLASLPNDVMAFGRSFSVVKVRLSCGGNTQDVEKTVEAALTVLTVLLFLPLKLVAVLVSLDLVPVPPLVQTYKDELAPRNVRLIGSGWPGTSICAWPGKPNINVMHNISSVMHDCSHEWLTGNNFFFNFNAAFTVISFADVIGSPRQSKMEM